MTQDLPSRYTSERRGYRSDPTRTATRSPPALSPTDILSLVVISIPRDSQVGDVRGHSLQWIKSFSFWLDYTGGNC